MKTKLALGLLLLVAACGEDERPDQVAPGSGAMGSGGTSGAGGSAGSSSGGTAGDGDGGEGNMMPGAPVVMVTSPDALAHPSEGEVLLADEVNVLCRVTKSAEAGSQPVNPSTVQIQALDAGGSVVAEAAGTPTNNDNEYSADVIIASVPNGIVSFRCTAADTSEIPVVGEHMISTFVDHGPAINAKNPLPESAHALLGSLRFEFTVDPAPLAADDDQATLSEVELEVNGIQIDVMNSGDNLYVADVSLNDPTVFPTKPSDEVAVVIRATNIRTPTAGERFESYSFVIDGTGPVIEIISHTNEQVIGGQETLEFTVIDELVGVDEQSVVVEINEVQHRFDPMDGNWTHTDGLFTFRMDSRNVSGSVAQLTIDISASDTVGNTSNGESRTLFLDNQPPTVDLDPGNVRERKREPPNVFCSEAFDPLGDGVSPNRGMPNDRTVVTNVILPRALVWDRTNSAPGQSYFYLAGTDPLNVYLYLQDQTAVPLTVDTDQNGICDDIDRELDLPFIRLNPIPPKGEPYYGPADGLTPPISGCTFRVAPDDPPPLPLRPTPLCQLEDSDMTRVIPHTIAGAAEPVIFGKGTITDLECTGGEWELTQFVPQEGWICLAAVAVDKKGNRSVSAPLRLCYDNGLTPGQPACVNDPGSAPACTLDCSPPAPFGENIFEFK